MADKEISIIGAGTYGEVILELAELCGFKAVAFYDDDESKIGSFIDEVPVKGKIDFDQINVSGNNFAVSIGNNKTREKFCDIIRQKGGNTPSLVHPKAIVSKGVEIGEGCFVHAQTMLWTKCKLHDYCICSPSVVIAHHTLLEKAAFVSAGSNVGAGIVLKKRAFVGIGSTIMTGVKTIGMDATVGAGAVVIKNVESNNVVVGNPAKVIRSNN